MVQFIRSLYFPIRLFALLGALVLAFVVAYYVPAIEGIVRISLVTLIGLTVFDFLLLYTQKHGVFARRTVSDRLSNGDLNPIEIVVENHYRFAILTSTIDEIPHQFQRRDIQFLASLAANSSKVIGYEIRPVKRGEFNFGRIHVYVNTRMGL
ncbi:MAG: DUF58 domain-containing protein, partial [Bacteroidota bacterium]